MPESGIKLDVTDALVVVSGEIDAHTCPDLSAALDPLPGSGDVRLDLSGVSFMDSSGLRVLISTHSAAVAAGRKLIIAGPSASVLRVVEITGLLAHLNVVTK